MITIILHKIQSFFHKPKFTRDNSSLKNKRETLHCHIEKDLQRNDIQKAISRLEGALECNPLDMELNDKLAKLYFQNNDLKKAGKYWYLKSEKGDKELLAVKLFSNSLGNDPILILKKLINKHFYKFSLLDDKQIEILKVLLDRIKANNIQTPKFLRALDCHLQKREKKNYC